MLPGNPSIEKKYINGGWRILITSQDLSTMGVGDTFTSARKHYLASWDANEFIKSEFLNSKE